MNFQFASINLHFLDRCMFGVLLCFPLRAQHIPIWFSINFDFVSHRFLICFPWISICCPWIPMLFSGNLYLVFHKFLFGFSEILVVSTFLKSELFCRARPASRDPPQASQVNHARRPAPKPARWIMPGPPNHESGQGPQASQVGHVRTPKPAGMIRSQTTVEFRVLDKASC